MAANDLRRSSQYLIPRKVKQIYEYVVKITLTNIFLPDVNENANNPFFKKGNPEKKPADY